MWRAQASSQKKRYSETKDFHKAYDRAPTGFTSIAYTVRLPSLLSKGSYALMITTGSIWYNAHY